MTELTAKDAYNDDGSMNHKYFEIQIEQFLEEVIGTLSYASVIVMKESADEIRCDWIDAVAHEIRKLTQLMKLHPDYDEVNENFERLSEYFHNIMRTEFHFATVDYRPFD